MALPTGFQPSDEYAKSNFGMSLADYYAKNPGAEQENQQRQQTIDNSDPLKVAAKVRDFNIQSNQPAIQSYEASKTPLQDRYKNLIDTIKGNQQVAENRQTTTTNNELAKRGISNDSGVYQQALTDSINPITQQYTGMQKDAMANENVDLSAIDRAIAELKTGNPASAVSAGASISGQAQQAQQFQQDLAMKQALQSYQMNQPAQQDRYATLGEGQTLYDLLNGGAVYTAPKTYKSTGTGSSNLPDLNSIFGG